MVRNLSRCSRMRVAAGTRTWVSARHPSREQTAEEATRHWRDMKEKVEGVEGRGGEGRVEG
jgi:hypothetical protein